MFYNLALTAQRALSLEERLQHSLLTAPQSSPHHFYRKVGTRKGRTQGTELLVV